MPSITGNILLFYCSKAEYDVYSDISKDEQFENQKYLLFDATEISHTSFTRKDLKIKSIVFHNTYSKLKLPSSIKQFIIIYKLRLLIKKVIKVHQPVVVLMGQDIDPQYLLILDICKKKKIKTIVFQHGIYTTTERKDYLIKQFDDRRFNKFQYRLYFFGRKVLALLGFLPERGVYGGNGASKYIFYSKYFRDLYKDTIQDDKTVIIPPTKFSNKIYFVEKNKKDIIVYGALSIDKYFYYLKYDDKTVINKICRSIPKNYTLIIKPHPVETKEYYEGLLNSNYSNVIVKDPQDEISEILSDSKALITMGSSIIFEAILLKNIVINLNLGNKIQFEDEALLMPQINDINLGYIKSLLNEDKYNKILDNQNAVFEKYLTGYSQDSVSLFMNSIYNCIDN